MTDERRRRMREPNVIGAMVKASPTKLSTDGFRFHTLSRSTAKRALRAALEEAERMEYSEGGSSMYWLRKAIEPSQEGES